MSSADARGGATLVVHVIYRFECGGLQTLLAECINRMPAHRYRHAVVCLTGHTDYAKVIDRPDVAFYTLDKQPGQSLSSHLTLWRLLRRLRPDVLHTYNISTIEYHFTAWLAGVRRRIHAEHGRDSVEMDGAHRKYNLLRRLLVPIIDRYVPVSADLAQWLRHTVGVPERKIDLVANGVDLTRYVPAKAGSSGPIWIGTVGRIDPIKNHAGLLDAFALVLARYPEHTGDIRLAIVGDGPLLPALRERVAQERWADQVWFSGARPDVADILRSFTIFVLPSLSEGTPVTLLEAMATGLPVVATRVGGVPQLVLDGDTGMLVAPSDPLALATALADYIDDPDARTRHGAAGRARIQANYSVDAMVTAYEALYDGNPPAPKR